MKIYISAPISGVADNNRQLFDSVEKLLTEQGYNVVNPLKLGNEGGWLDCVIRDLQAMRECDAVIFLPHWEYSQGCKVERLVAETLGIKMFHTTNLTF